MSTDGSVSAQPAPAVPHRKLKRSMGLWMATALVVGAVTGAGAILLALVFANLARALPRTGGPYAYAKRRGEEVTADVIDGPSSAVWQQAANRLPTEQAALYALATGWEG
jgi:amino acid transporter